ncbi:MAG: sulfotransferase family protein [Sphingomonas bacterium]
MALSIIGSGFGRTGTRSLKDALELLGHGPCHHMEEVFPSQEQIMLWSAFAEHGTLDHDRIFKDYSSQVDWPGAHAWRQLAAAYPDARVIHSVRPEESWWRSFSVTIGKFLAIYPGMDLPPHIRDMSDTVMELIGVQTFAGDFGDKEKALAAYRQREAEVRAAIPADRLLIFDVAEGWEPLCRFLEVDMPDTPFPRTNDRSDFWVKLGGEPA